jgi:hypothetical protein
MSITYRSGGQDVTPEMQQAADLHLLATPLRVAGEWIKMALFILIAPVAVVIWVIYCLVTGTAIGLINGETFWILFRVACAVYALTGPFIIIFLAITSPKLAKFVGITYVGMWVGIGVMKLNEALEHRHLLATTYHTQLADAQTFKLRVGESEQKAIKQIYPLLAVKSAPPGALAYWEPMQCNEEIMFAEGVVSFRKGRLESVEAVFNMHDKDPTQVNSKQFTCLIQTITLEFGKSDNLTWHNNKTQENVMVTLGEDDWHQPNGQVKFSRFLDISAY